MGSLVAISDDVQLQLQTAEAGFEVTLLGEEDRSVLRDTTTQE